MNQKTWNLINQKYGRFRSYYAEGVEKSEFDEKFVDFVVPADYRDFVLRYGGGLVGTYPIYGLRRAEAMGTIGRKATACEITRMYREQKWPGLENWLVFSVDQSGNPVGFADDGAVWISDGPRGQIQKLADSFEDFILKWALRATSPE